MALYYVGTSGWSYNHWKGDFYPAGLARTRWFAYYAQQFNSVEINATFYGSFKDATYEKWRDQVPPDFRYVLKVPKPITHLKQLVNVDEDIAVFRRSAALLEDRLGMLLLQLAPSTPYDPARLRAALRAFGDPTRLAVEFRSKAWEQPEIRDLLSEEGAALVSVGAPNSHLTEWVTGPRAYIRLHGPDKWYASNYSEEQLAEIAALARRMAERGAGEVYIFFNNDVGGFAPKNALTLRQQLS
jgi:uncharacterized protein YecE (DUF72 family)